MNTTKLVFDRNIGMYDVPNNFFGVSHRPFSMGKDGDFSFENSLTRKKRVGLILMRMN